MNMLFKNCNLISPDVELDGASILVENNMIRKIFAKGDALPQADKVIDVNGEMTVPGFVDVHCHGKSGVDFSDATDEAMTTDRYRQTQRGCHDVPSHDAYAS